MKAPRKIVLKTMPIFIIMFTLLSCEKIKNAAEFDLLYSVPETKITVDSTILEAAGNVVMVLEKTIHISLDSIRQKHNLDKFEEARFDYIRLEVDIPARADLRWIQRLEATVIAPGISETRVASYVSDGSSSKTIDMVLDDAPITPFLMAETFRLRIYASVTPPLPASVVKLNLKSRIRITVQPI
jgi:hypothetical protein